MEPVLGEHEVIRWRQAKVDVRLSTPDGTAIVSRGCQVLLSNQNIHLIASSAATYNVPGKGDRTFRSATIPIRIAKPHRFIQPWFGPYKWETVISGRIPTELEPRNSTWTLLLTFSEGGAFDYRKAFLREFAAVSQAAQEGMDETLPAYSEY